MTTKQERIEFQRGWEERHVTKEHKRIENDKKMEVGWDRFVKMVHFIAK